MYRPAAHRVRVAAAAWVSSATATTLPDTCVTAAGRKVTTTPPAIAVAAKTTEGRTSAGVRRPASTPSGCSDRGSRPGRPSTAATPDNAVTAPATKTSG